MGSGAAELGGWAALIVLILVVINWPWHALAAVVLLALAVTAVVVVRRLWGRRAQARHAAEQARRAAVRLAVEVAQLRAAGFPETLVESWITGWKEPDGDHCPHQ